MFVFQLRVYYEDTDAGGVVYHANYLNFAQRARTEWLRNLYPAGYHSLGIQFVVVNAALRYRQPARLDDWLRVETTVSQLGTARLILQQDIYRDSVLLCPVTIELACVNNTLRPCRLPSELVAQIKP